MSVSHRRRMVKMAFTAEDVKAADAPNLDEQRRIQDNDDAIFDQRTNANHKSPAATQMADHDPPPPPVYKFQWTWQRIAIVLLFSSTLSVAVFAGATPKPQDDVMVGFWATILSWFIAWIVYMIVCEYQNWCNMDPESKENIKFGVISCTMFALFFIGSVCVLGKIIVSL